MKTDKGFLTKARAINWRWFSLLLVVLFLAACSSDVPKALLEPEAFQDCNRVVSSDRADLLDTTGEYCLRTQKI